MTSQFSYTPGNPKGVTLGVMGGGQLGRMFVQTAQRMGFQTAVLDPDLLSPAGLIAHHHIKTDYLDVEGLAKLVAVSDAITTEFENVPAPALARLAQHKPTYPSAAAVAICQDRTVEKNYFVKCGVQCAPFVEIKTLADCDNAAAAPNLFPAILKTAQMGYDGKGQVTVHTPAELGAAWAGLNAVRCVLEKKLPLAQELSVILARNARGDIVNLPVQENVHRHGVLSTTTVPAPSIDAALAAQAVESARCIASETDYVGVLCVEFFVLQDGQLIANELAPRPHNSGHYSIDACDIDQFELQVRALTGLPLVTPHLHQAAVMINLLGDIWLNAAGQVHTPNFDAVLAIAGAKLHLYGKAVPKAGRKMGHITVTAETVAQAQAKAAQAAAALGITL